MTHTLYLLLLAGRRLPRCTCGATVWLSRRRVHEPLPRCPLNRFGRDDRLFA